MFYFANLYTSAYKPKGIDKPYIFVEIKKDEKGVFYENLIVIYVFSEDRMEELVSKYGLPVHISVIDDNDNVIAREDQLGLFNDKDFCDTSVLSTLNTILKESYGVLEIDIAEESFLYDKMIPVLNNGLVSIKCLAYETKFE